MARHSCVMTSARSLPPVPRSCSCQADGRSLLVVLHVSRSLYNQRNDSPKWRLLDVFGGLIAGVRPDIVSMENVPRLIDFRDGTVFHRFTHLLRKFGYDTWCQIVNAADYGVPQQRHRLVLLASRLGPIALEPPQHRPENYRTVAEAIGHLAPLKAGNVDTNDPLHRASRLSERNKHRIVTSRPGGTWRDWNDALIAPCHRADTGRGYASVYGRMVWDQPSPTITTQYYGFGSGRFGHPEQDRAISLREGAILQSFPDDYAFVSPGRESVQFKVLGRMVGNAVPVHLARAIARSIRRHLEDHA